MKHGRNLIMMSKKNYEEFWNEAIRQIREKYELEGVQEEFDRWFRMEYLEDDLKFIKVAVPSDFMLSTLIKKGYINEIKSKIGELCGQNIDIIFVVNSQKTTTKKNENKITGANRKSDISSFHNLSKFIYSDSSRIKTENQYLETKNHVQLREDFTFDKFVRGENNEYAYSASLAAAKNPGKKYNPLFIYGGVGLGKTHLMQSIGNYILNNPLNEKKNVKICYITAENFLNEMTFAIRDNSSEKFHRKYRSLDVLLLDDIHFLQNKTATQEEVFFTFEALTKLNSQIVFTCDRPPSDLNGISDRLKSRFAANLIIDLRPPNYEVRKAILLKKIELKKKFVPEEVIDFIAKNIQSNVRELESCLENTIAYSELLQRKLTIDVAKKYLSTRTRIADEAISIGLIQKTVANYYEISVGDIRGVRRNKKIVFARHIAIYISRILTELSFNEIASEFGGKDHSTIMHSFDKIESLLKVDEDLNSTIELLIQKIKGKKG